MRARIHVGMPLYGHVPGPCMVSFSMAMIQGVAKGIVGGVTQLCGSYIDWGRNDIVREALQNNSTHLFFMDQDMLVPEDSIVRLLDYDKDIVGGLYFLKQYPHYPVAFHLDPFSRDIDLSPGGLVKVGGVGMGCTLIKTDVLRAIKDKLKDEWWFKIEAGIGEDVWFSERAALVGAECWLDTDLTCGHMTDVAITRRHYDEARQRGQAEGMSSAITGGMLAERDPSGESVTFEERN